MKYIIDAHSHIFPSKIATKATASIGAFYGIDMDMPGSVESLLQYKMIDKSVVCSSATTMHQVSPINDFIFSQCAQHEKLIGLATLSPDMTKEMAAAELDRLSSCDIHGFKFHPDFQNYQFDDKNVYPLYELICERGYPILVHAGDKRYSRSNPSSISRVAKDFPQLKICAAHFGGYSEWDKLAEYEGVENVWFDTCSSLPFISPEVAKGFIDKFGAHRFMFGSDFPMWRPDEEIDRFEKINLSQAEKDMIYYKNATDFYNIKL